MPNKYENKRRNMTIIFNKEKRRNKRKNRRKKY